MLVGDRLNILVTGGAGYIGSHIVRLLCKEHNIIVYDSLVKGHAESIPQDIELVKGCLSDTKLVDATFSRHKPDAVIHLAGFIEAGESMKEPEKYFQNNVANGLNLLSTMRKHGVKKIVFASSAAVYGEPKKIPITESSKKIPTNYYGLSKLMFEQFLDAYAIYGFKSICLRFFNASGAGFGIGEHHDPETHLIPLVLQVALGKRESIKMFGKDYPTKDGTCIRDYVHVLDIAKAHKLALEAIEKGITGAYNLGTNTGYSVKEVIDIAREVTKHPVPAIEEGKRQGDPAVLVASYDKAFKELGWKPEHGLRETISDAWAWHSQNPHGFSSVSQKR